MADDGEELEKVFAEVGRERGFDFVGAKYFPFKELKSSWHRNRWRIDFRISDYLSGCETEVISDIAESLFSKVTRGHKAPYSERVMNWLKSPDFLKRNRPIYLERSRNLSLSAAGANYDLEILKDNLRGRDLLEDSEDVYLTWTRGDNRKRVGYCSVLMKVIAVSSALDRSGVPSFVPEYVLYHEILHLETGRETLSPRHGKEFRRRERLFPLWEEAESWLRTIASKRS